VSDATSYKESRMTDNSKEVPDYYNERWRCEYCGGALIEDELT